MSLGTTSGFWYVVIISYSKDSNALQRQYNACDPGQYRDAEDAHRRCLKLNPNVPDAQARYQVPPTHLGDFYNPTLDNQVIS